MSNPTGNISESSLFELFTGSASGAPSSGINVDPYALDTMSTASNGEFSSISSFNSNAVVLTAPENAELTLIQFAKIVNSATNNLKAQINSSDTLQTGLNIELWRENAAWAVSIMDIKRAMTSISKAEIKLHKDQVSGSLNYNVNTIEPYNTYLNSVSATTNAMYLLQQQYANGSITDDAYNLAVDQWNANLEALNAAIQTQYNNYSAATAAYNSQVSANNTKISELNAQRQAAGITDDLPLQTPAALAPLQLLSNIPHGPPAPTSPTVPAAFATVPSISTSTGISTAISVSPTTAQERAFLNSIKNALDALYAGPITDYNTFLLSTQDEMTSMSLAMNDYKNGLISVETYNAAVNHYNAYAETANPQLLALRSTYQAAVNSYNEGLDAINDQINEFNGTREGLGQQLIPKQNRITVPTASQSGIPQNIPLGPPIPTNNPFPIAPPVFLPPVPEGSVTPTNPNRYIKQYFTPLFAESLAGLMNYTKTLTLQQSYRDFLLFTLSGKSNLLPNNAFIDRFPEVFFAQDGQSSTISGVGLTSMIVSLDNRSLSSIITQTLLASSNTNGIDISQQIIDKTVLFGLSSLQKASLESALTALSLIKDQLNPDNLESTATKVVLAAVNLNVIQNLVNSGAIGQALSSFLAEEGLSATDTAAMIAALNSSLSVGLLQFGTTQLARIARLPGLLPQILANLPDAKLRELLIAASAKNLQTFIANPVSVLSLKDTLAKELIDNGNFDSALAQNQINNAINHTFENRSDNLQSSLNATDDLRISLLRNLIREGINENTAMSLAQQGVDFIRSDLISQDLDTSFIKQTFLQKDATIQQILKTSIAQDAYNKALNADNINKFETKRQFQHELIAQLRRQGIDLTSANLLADQVLASVRSNEIRNSFLTERINQEILLHSLNSIANTFAHNNTTTPQSLQNAVSATFALNPLTEFEFRTSLNAQLALAGVSQINANQLSANAAIAIHGNDPLKSPVMGDFLDRGPLAEQIVAELTKQLKGAFGLTLGTELATRTASLLVGTALATDGGERIQDEVRRPTSVLNVLIQAYAEVKNTNEENYAKIVIEGSREFRKPSVDLFDFLKRVMDPANSLLLTAGSGIMYEGMGRRPDNFKKELDIQI